MKFGLAGSASVTVLGVAWNGSRQAMEDFVDRHNLSFPSLVDMSGEVFGRYGIPFQPAWIFLDDQGEMTRVLGSLGAASLQQYINDLTS